MKKLTIAPPIQFSQQTLFEIEPERPTPLTGQRRAISGVVCEDVVREMLSLTPIVNNGMYDVNYDGFKEDTYYEIKSLREGNKCPLYDFRLEKDMNSGVRLLYVFAINNCDGNVTSEMHWRRELGRTLNTLVIIPARIVRLLAARQPLNHIKETKTKSGERNGYRRKGYRDGYRNVPYSDLILSQEKVGEVSAEIFGIEYKAKVMQ